MLVIPRGAWIAPAPLWPASAFSAAASLSLRKLPETLLRVEEV